VATGGQIFAIDLLAILGVDADQAARAVGSDDGSVVVLPARFAAKLSFARNWTRRRS
jgi:hypothetical protein